jgi:hypothetical protein
MSSNPDHVEWAEPPTKTSTLILKICAFGAAAFVGTGLLGLLIYILFFRKGHRQRKTARREEEVFCSNFPLNESAKLFVRPKILRMVFFPYLGTMVSERCQRKSTLFLPLSKNNASGIVLPVIPTPDMTTLTLPILSATVTQIQMFRPDALLSINHEPLVIPLVTPGLAGALMSL